jgi:thymidine phosphorylase
VKAHLFTARRMGIDTYRQPVVFMRSDCLVCRSEGFEALTRVNVQGPRGSIVATLNVVTTDLLAHGEAGLSEEAWTRLEVESGEALRLSHAPLIHSFGHVRAKMYGHRIDLDGFRAVVGDIDAGLYPDVHISSFLTACSGNNLDTGEISALAQAMIAVGERLQWSPGVVVDKHCIGGLPGNRTTPIVVAIAAAAGLRIPKTSSRAITSPAGTADVMETMTRVDLDLDEMRDVVERHGGCLAWGGSVGLCPVDDLLIRVERALDVDSEGQLVASVLSKKAAAGSTHVLIDIPWGPTAKVRSVGSASALARDLREVGRSVGLVVTTMLTDGTQPVGRGVGPALEAHDVLAVLRGETDAPRDLRLRALALASRLLEIGGVASDGAGAPRAEQILESGAAWESFRAICEAQGGFREPGRASFTQPIGAQRDGVVTSIDNRRLARVAKLAGAPTDPVAGLELHVAVGAMVERDQPLFTLHSDSTGERDYALQYLRTETDIFQIGAVT